MRRSTIVGLIVGYAITSAACGGGDPADSKTEERVAALESQIAALEGRVAELQEQLEATATTQLPATTVAATPSTVEVGINVYGTVAYWLGEQYIEGGPAGVSIFLSNEALAKPVTISDLELTFYELGFPAPVIDDLSDFRRLDGTETADGSGVTATWSYDPETGLSMVIERTL